MTQETRKTYTTPTLAQHGSLVAQTLQSPIQTVLEQDPNERYEFGANL